MHDDVNYELHDANDDLYNVNYDLYDVNCECDTCPNYLPHLSFFTIVAIIP